MSVPIPDPGDFDAIPLDAAESSVGERFATVAARWPERIAVDAGSECLGYAELAATADRVAHHILSTVGSKTRVGFLFERHLSLLPSILGTLHAGAVYVPIDPGFPAARIASILDDAEIGLVLCDDHTEAFARNQVARRHPISNADALAAAPQASGNPDPVDPDSIASIFYTSGSTGEPKGVIQNHRNLIHYARCYAEILRTRPADRASLLFSYSFSASIPDIFGTLLSGATLCPFDVKRGGPAGLTRWVGESEISLLHMVPSLFRHFVGHIEAEQEFPFLRAVDLGGEAASDDDVAAFRRHFSAKSVLVHRMAATEASLISEYAVDREIDVADGMLPIGRPVDGMQIRIADENGEEVAVGEVGEIVLHSRYLSPGYWRKPELTSAAFSDDPAGDGIRCFRTGDRGRLRSDGLFEHLGRNDQRVKIRGYTIETAEVEAALRSCRSVRECAVIAWQRPGRDALLTAFVEARPGAAFSEAQVLRELRSRLPEYALPARLHIVERLPLTATGKIDRGRLETADLPSPSRTPESVAPSNPIEAKLASIWREELGLESLGVSDDYFALGGTSLQAVQIMARIEEQFGRDVSPSILLEAPTIERLAKLIDRDELPESGGLTVALKAGGSRPPLFCFPGIGGEPIIYKAFVQHLDEDQPCYGIQTPGLVGQRRPPSRIDDHVGPQLEAIRRIQPQGPYFLAGYSFGSTVAFAVAQRLGAEGERVALLAMIDGWGPGYPALLPDASVIHRLLDRWLGWTLSMSQRGRPATLLFQFLKMRGRDLECRLRLLSGRSLTRVQRKRRHKRAALRARNRYWPKPIDAPLLLIRSSPEPGQTLFDHDPLRGWQPFARRPIEVFDAPGLHIELLDEPNVETVATAINGALEAAWARSCGN